MRSINNTVFVDTQEKQQLLNLTSSVRKAVDASWHGPLTTRFGESRHTKSCDAW